MKTLIGVAVASVVIAVYVVWLRPKMRKTAWGQRFLDWIEPIERTLWKNSETILRARAKVLFGIVLTGLTWLGGIDVNDILPLVPDAYDSYVVMVFKTLPLWISVSGFIDEKLRRDTTKPLEIVAMRTDAPIEVKMAAAQAEAATANVVATVVEAEAKAA